MLGIVLLAWAGFVRFDQWRAQQQYAEPLPAVATTATVTPREMPSQTQSQSPAPTPSATASAVPSPQPVVGIVPQHITIPGTTINTDIIEKPSVTCSDPHKPGGKDNSTCFGVPQKGDVDAEGNSVDPWAIAAYWSDGPKLGEVNTANNVIAVVLGHTVSSTVGAFRDIGTLAAGTEVIFTDRQGAIVRLQVLEVRNGVAKSGTDTLYDTLKARPADAIAALVTCSGDTQNLPGFGTSHEDNTVVFLGPVQGE